MALLCPATQKKNSLEECFPQIIAEEALITMRLGLRRFERVASSGIAKLLNAAAVNTELHTQKSEERVLS